MGNVHIDSASGGLNIKVHGKYLKLLKKLKLHVNPLDKMAKLLKIKTFKTLYYSSYLENIFVFRFYVKSHVTIVGATIKNRDRGLILSIHGRYLASNKMSSIRIHGKRYI